jgi:hypothetical protein
VETIDTNDIDWVFRDDDEDMDAENVRIKEIATTSKRPVGRRDTAGQMEWEGMRVRLFARAG